MEFTLNWVLSKEGMGSSLMCTWQGGRVKEKRKRREVLFASVIEKLLVRCSFEMQPKRVDKLNKFHAYMSQPMNVQNCATKYKLCCFFM